MCIRDSGLDYMRDEFPELAPNETVRLNCLRGQKLVTLHCIDLTEDDFSFPEVARNLTCEGFLKSQRQKFEEARLRAMTSRAGVRDKKPVRLDAKLLRAKVRRKLLKKKRKAEIGAFLIEARARQDEGYSMRQLVKSHIPDIGGEVKVAEREVTAEMRMREERLVETSTVQT